MQFDGTTKRQVVVRLSDIMAVLGDETCVATTWCAEHPQLAEALRRKRRADGGSSRATR